MTFVPQNDQVCACFERFLNLFPTHSSWSCCWQLWVSAGAKRSSWAGALSRSRLSNNSHHKTPSSYSSSSSSSLSRKFWEFQTFALCSTQTFADTPTEYYLTMNVWWGCIVEMAMVCNCNDGRLHLAMMTMEMMTIWPGLHNNPLLGPLRLGGPIVHSVFQP